MFSSMQRSQLLHFIKLNNVIELQNVIKELNGCDWKTYRLSLNNSFIHVAARHGSLDIIKYLDVTEGVAIDDRNDELKTPLHEAAQSEQLECVKYLLSRGVGIDSIKRADWTPLMLACTKSNLEVVKCLVESGANLHLKNKDGWTPFHIACREGDVNIINYLLDQDPNLWKNYSKNKRTPLHSAALYGHKAVIEILIRRDSYSPGKRDSCGTTCLMDAARSNHLTTLQLLAQFEEIDAQDDSGRNALHHASQAGAIDCIKYLVKSGLSVNNNCLNLASKADQKEAIKVLLQLQDAPSVL